MPAALPHVTSAAARQPARRAAAQRAPRLAATQSLLAPHRLQPAARRATLLRAERDGYGGGSGDSGGGGGGGGGDGSGGGDGAEGARAAPLPRTHAALLAAAALPALPGLEALVGALYVFLTGWVRALARAPARARPR